jgi:hypothetical protein
VWFTHALIVAARSIDHLLTVGTAGGLILSGWLCVAVNVVNVVCREANDPAWLLLFRSSRERGEHQEPDDVLRHALVSLCNAGGWTPGRTSLGNWTTAGSLVGATFGIIAYLLHV